MLHHALNLISEVNNWIFRWVFSFIFWFTWCLKFETVCFSPFFFFINFFCISQQHSQTKIYFVFDLLLLDDDVLVEFWVLTKFLFCMQICVGMGVTKPVLIAYSQKNYLCILQENSYQFWYLVGCNLISLKVKMFKVW